MHESPECDGAICGDSFEGRRNEVSHFICGLSRRQDVRVVAIRAEMGIAFENNILFTGLTTDEPRKPYDMEINQTSVRGCPRATDVRISQLYCDQTSGHKGY